MTTYIALHFFPLSHFITASQSAFEDSVSLHNHPPCASWMWMKMALWTFMWAWSNSVLFGECLLSIQSCHAHLSSSLVLYIYKSMVILHCPLYFIGSLCWLLSSKLWSSLSVAPHSTRYYCRVGLLQDSCQVFKHQGAKKVQTRWLLGASRYQLMHIWNRHKEPYLTPYNWCDCQWRKEQKGCDWWYTEDIWKSGQYDVLQN